MKVRAALAAIAMIGGVTTGPAAAQSPGVGAAEGNWVAWFGCWRSAGETPAPGETVCVLPGDDRHTARFVTVDGDRVSQENTIRADGVARPVQEGGCAGHQSASFSADGRRVFTRSELMCSNATRVTTGVLAFTSRNGWVDSQALTVRDQHAARSVAYDAIPLSGLPSEVTSAVPGSIGLALEAARLDASGPIDIEGIVEAAAVLAAPALDGFLAATSHRFALSASNLRELRERGVAPSTIDVMVAVSYPERFAVRPREEPVALPGSAGLMPGPVPQYCYDPFWSSRFNDCFSSFGYSSRYGSYGYSPWGYDPYGWRYSESPVFVIVEPGSGRGGGTVDRDRGYTPGTANTPGTATPRATAPQNDTSRPSSAPSTSAGPTGSAGAAGGYTPTSSGGGEGTRTARPRGSED